jgi:PKD repeat protein
MKQITGHNLVIIACAIVITGGYIFPVTSALCDGPPQSQSFILFSGGCDQSLQGLPCTQGFMFPAQPSAGGDFPTQYFLDFGDGSPPYFGPVDGVTHTYNHAGRYVLKFMAGTQCDLWRSDTFMMTIPAPGNYSPIAPVCVPGQPSAGFTGRPSSGSAPLTVQFTSTSTGDNTYMWNFGDGGMSPAQNPLHTYRTPGIYPVSLEAKDICTGTVNHATMSNFITVTAPATTLSVTSNPTGAAIFIDNLIKGRTPLTLTDTAIGDHRLTITMDGYEEYTRNIIVEASTPLTIAAVLTMSVPQPTTRPPPNGSIALTSVPSGADVYLDGKQKGTAPAIFPDILPGNHQVTLLFKGYDEWSRIVSVGSGQTAAINAVLVATKEITGSLAVITDPPGAEISIDGDFKGVSPVTIPGLYAGTHTVLLKLQEYADTTSNISITAGQTRMYTTELHKQNRLSAIDLLLAAGAIGMIVVIALAVMLKQERKKK